MCYQIATQTEVQTQILCLIRLSRPKLSLIRLSRQKLTLIRLSGHKFPLIRLFRHKVSLIRLFRQKLFWSDYLQTMAQTQIQTIAQNLIGLWSNSSELEKFMIRFKCAQNSLIRERFHLWTNLLILLYFICFKKTDVCSI